MARFEILAGLPPYGPPALPFPSDGQGSFREGFVIRFHPSGGEPWEGNFQRGFTKLDAAFEHPDGRQVVIIAGGSVYVIDPELRQETNHLSEGINYALTLPELKEIVVGDDVGFGAIRSDGTAWNSIRISWDGFRNVKIEGDSLTGEAFSPIGNTWSTFTLNLRSGECTGAVYQGDIARAQLLRPSRESWFARLLKALIKRRSPR